MIPMFYTNKREGTNNTGIDYWTDIFLVFTHYWFVKLSFTD